MSKTNFKILVAAAVMLLSGCAYMNAQVTVGANTAPNATLDVVASNPTGQTVEGIIAPRLTGDQIQSRNALYGTAHKGVIIYATSAVSNPIVGDKTENITAAGYYYFDGTAWKAFSTGLKWFYMPSIAIDVSQDGTFKRNLYLEYKKQFDDTSDNITDILTSPKMGTAIVKNISAPELFDRIYEAEELNYYIIGYDATVFSNVSISNSGELTYTILDADKASDETFMNIVLVVR